ncbi:MAG: glycosyltransferase family 2 protein [Ardenticatenaceae bacterium]
MSQCLVSVIIPAWNGHEHLESCLSALLRQSYSPLEVIVVDNASSDGSADLVEKKFPAVRLIRNAKNLGFGGGCNTGLRAAEGKILILLNQDTIVEPEWTGALVEVFEADPTIGIAGGKAFYPDGTIQHAGGYVDKHGVGHHYGYRKPDNGQFDQIRDVDFVTGATLAISRQAFERIGELDDGFRPAYFEDVDWCYRARHAGFRTVYVPEARLIHQEESKAGDESDEGKYLMQRNRIRFVLKQWPIARLREEFLPTEQEWLRVLRAQGHRLVNVIERAYLFHLLHLADVMKWRQTWLNSAIDEADQLAQILITLRTKKRQSQNRAAHESLVADLLAELQKRPPLQEHQFRSDVPVIGPLIAMFRRQWSQVAARWSVRVVIEQQNEINALVIQTLTDLQRGQKHLTRQLSEDIN